MKKIIILLAVIPAFAQAQLLGGKNIIKANLSSLAFGNYHATFERAILKKMSISVSYRYGEKKALPLEKLTRDFIDDPNLNFGRFMLGNSAITPELRLYLGMGKMKGFYVAPYARFANFDFTIPVKYQTGFNVTADADFVGTIKSTSYGVMFGTQYQILKKLVLDIWIVGGHYGTSKGDLVATFPNLPNGQLSASQRADLEKSIESIDLTPFKIKGTIAADNKSATIVSDGPWAGVRGLGLSLGFRF